MTNPDTRLAHELREHARRLEAQVAIPRLLTTLFHFKGDEIDRTLGRYHFLGKAIEQRPQLLQALLDGNDESINREWSRVLQKYQSDARFLHGLAVIYWECALAALAKQQEDTGHYWVFSTTLWALLLSSKAFWEYFSETRRTNDKGERLPLSTNEQDALLGRSLEDILNLHSKYGSENFAAHRYEQARAYLRCLDLCQSGEKALVATLKEYEMPWLLKLDNRRMEELTKQAKRILDAWCAKLVGEAERNANDAEAIKRLPQGIRLNYEGGIRCLEPFIKLNIPVVRILTTSLDWYNDWCYDLYVTKDIERIKSLMKPAREVADQLIPLSTQSLEHRQENQVLSQHFLMRGFTTDDPKLAIKEYEEAVKWNSTNSNAKKLLGDSYQSVLMKQLKVAIECVERKQFEEAYQILDNIEKEATDKTKVQEARANICFRHANMLANDGKFREALIPARKARKLNQKEPVIQDFLNELEKLAPEEDNLRHLQSANEAYEEDRYDQAIQSASQVSAQSRFAGQARRLQSASYFHRGIEAANKHQRFEQAAADLEHALQLNEDREERAVISRQLEALQQVQIGSELRRAMETKNFAKAEQLMRRVLASQTSRKERQAIQDQLSAILNAHAVSLVNEAQESEKEFGEALVRIVSVVKEVLSFSRYGASGLEGNSSCAVCEKNQAAGSGWESNYGRILGKLSPDYGKGRVVLTVVEAVQSSGGKFSVSSPIQFWVPFMYDLCSSCQSKLASIGAKKGDAVNLLEEAIKLDSGNKSAKTNLAALKKM